MGELHGSHSSEFTCRASILRTSSAGQGETLGGVMSTLTSCPQGLAALMTACLGRYLQQLVHLYLYCANVWPRHGGCHSHHATSRDVEGAWTNWRGNWFCYYQAWPFGTDVHMHEKSRPARTKYMGCG